MNLQGYGCLPRSKGGAECRESVGSQITAVCGLAMCHPRPGHQAVRCCVLAHSQQIALYASMLGFPNQTLPWMRPPVSSASMEMYHLPKMLHGKLHGHCLTQASESTQSTHPTAIPNHPAFHHFFKSLWVEGSKKKKKSCLDDSLKMDDKAVSEQMGDRTLGGCCAGLSCALTHSFIHLSFIHSSIRLSVPSAS